MSHTSAVTAPLFAYGTLLVPEIMTAVIGRLPPSQPARLHGFARFCMRGQVYPGACPRPGQQVDGRVFFELTTDELARLDDYEGDAYECVTGEAQLEENARLEILVYVVRERYLALLSDQPWDLEVFRTEHAAGFGRSWS